VAEIVGLVIPSLMSALDFPEASSDPHEADLVEAGAFPTAAEAAEHGVVVLALGHPYWLLETPEGFRLLIEREAAPAAYPHLAAYHRERMRWPPPPILDPWKPRKTELLTPLLWAAIVLAAFEFTGRSPQWFDRGALTAQALFQNGEWWRPVTSLFLHANAPHVISNALSGILVFCAVVSTFGRLRGWTLVLLAGVLGNLAVAAANYPEPYSTVGASTAIIAGVGLLSGRAIRVASRSTHPHRWRAMFAPFAAGATVLALHGAGDQRVDVGAHFTGFLAGLMLGFVAGLVRADGGPSTPAIREPRKAPAHR
jgi:membrane associated rhomboid family serine protease